MKSYHSTAVPTMLESVTFHIVAGPVPGRASPTPPML